MQKKTFKILDMHCSNCPMILESIEDDLVGIKQISASYARGSMVVEFDETLLNVDQILAAINKKGYQAELPAA
jgi:P-type Cu+ transporter